MAESLKEAMSQDVRQEEPGEEPAKLIVPEYFGLEWADLQLRFDQELETKEMEDCIAKAVSNDEIVQNSSLSAKAPLYDPNIGWVQKSEEELNNVRVSFNVATRSPSCSCFRTVGWRT